MSSDYYIDLILEAHGALELVQVLLVDSRNIVQVHIISSCLAGLADH